MQFKYLALAGLTSLAAAQAQTPTLVQALNSTADLSNLTQIINGQPALAGQLASLQNITILAPNNEAVTEFLTQATSGGMQPSNDMIQAILSYHVLNGTYQNFSAESVFVPTALMNGDFADVSGGQVVEVRNTTVYSGLKSNSSIVQQSVNFTGGVIHIIDRVLTVPESVGDTLTAFNLTSAYGALNATDLLDAVADIEDVTIFVPNNAAFQAIGSALPNLTTEQIVAILQYHVINGTVAYSSLLSNMSVPTLQGNNVTITVQNATTVFVNNARVVIPDVLVANGVVHVIDEVLNPNNATAVSGGATEGAPAFEGASSVSDEPYTTGQPTPTSSINTGSIQASATGGSATSSGAAWVPRPTGAVGAAAIGGLALLMQL